MNELRMAWLRASAATDRHVVACATCRMAVARGVDTTCEVGARLCEEEATAWAESLPEPNARR